MIIIRTADISAVLLYKYMISYLKNMLLLEKIRKKRAFVMVDSLETLICPACGKEMKKVYIKDCDKVVDVCSQGCGGLFFDNQELKFFDEQNEDVDAILELLEGKSFIHVDTSETRICPVCNVPMVKNCSSGTNEIQIDECYTCGGKFLDFGELEGLREEFATDEERDIHFRSGVDSSITSALMEQDIALDLLRQRRSWLKKFFDAYIWRV